MFYFCSLFHNHGDFGFGRIRTCSFGRIRAGRTGLSGFAPSPKTVSARSGSDPLRGRALRFRLVGFCRCCRCGGNLLMVVSLRLAGVRMIAQLRKLCVEIFNRRLALLQQVGNDDLFAILKRFFLVEDLFDIVGFSAFVRHGKIAFYLIARPGRGVRTPRKGIAPRQ